MATKEPTVTDVLGEIGKKQNLRIGAMSDVIEPVVGLTTGNLAVDYLTGVGGIPQRRITELYGLPSSGKTTTALQCAAELQRQIITEGREDYILYLDYEQALDRDYAEALGIDVDHRSFILAQPNWLEQGADIALKLIGTGRVRMSIWDSIAAMTPKALIDGDFDQRTAAMNRARLMSGLFQRLASLLKEQHCCAIMINHLMESVEMSGRPGMPPKTTTPGGKGGKYYASLRLEYKQIGNIKTRTADPLTGDVVDLPQSTLVKVKCVKNKVGAPFREAEVRVRYGQGFDNFWSALQVAMAHKKITKDGAWYRFADFAHPDMPVPAKRPSLHGESAVLAFADTHPQWRAAVITEAAALIAAHGAAALDTGTGEPDDVLGTLPAELESRP